MPGPGCHIAVHFPLSVHSANSHPPLLGVWPLGTEMRHRALLPLDFMSREIDKDQTVKYDVKARIYCEKIGGDRMRPCPGSQCGCCEVVGWALQDEQQE